MVDATRVSSLYLGDSGGPIPLTVPILDPNSWVVVTSELLGSGSFSNVWRARVVRADDGSETDPNSCHSTGALSSPKRRKEYALKRLSEEASNSCAASRESARKDLRNEALILSRLPCHPNIIRLHAVSVNLWDDDGDNVDGACPTHQVPSTQRFLLLDLMTETLQDRLNKLRRQAKFRDAHRSVLPPFLTTVPRSLLFPEVRRERERGQLSRLYSIGLPLARGVAFVHGHSVALRDLKPSNIGFDSRGGVRLFDFGLARAVATDPSDDDSHARRRLTPCSGTLRYASPETLLTWFRRSGGGASDEDGWKEESPGANDLFASDVYSLSVVLWEIVTTLRPFQEIRTFSKAEERVARRHARPSLRAVESREVREVFDAGWDRDPSLRPTSALVVSRMEELIASQDGAP
jgi:serine/threonine protein kinase